MILGRYTLPSKPMKESVAKAISPDTLAMYRERAARKAGFTNRRRAAIKAIERRTKENMK